MNKREKINLNKWDRAELFREFIGMTTSIYDMTVRMDVTDLINYCKENNMLDEYSGRFYTPIPEIGNHRSDMKETAIPF